VKGNRLLFSLAFLLAALSVGVTFLAYKYVQLTRELNRAQWSVNQLEQRQNRFRALLAEAVDFSQRNPSMIPVLQSLGVRGSNAPAASPKPTTR
jgi:hypothetical protein